MAANNTSGRNDALDNNFVFSKSAEDKSKTNGDLAQERSGSVHNEELFLQNIFLKPEENQTILKSAEKGAEVSINQRETLVSSVQNEQQESVKPQSPINELELSNIKIASNKMEETDSSASLHTSLSTTAVVDDNLTTGTVVANLSSTIEDREEVFTYSLAKNNNFEIDGNQIKVKAGADLDYETEQNHKLDITVTDGTGNSYNETVTLAVNDINEAPTDIQLNHTAVDENASTGTVVAKLSATDEDSGESFTYTVADNNNFEIDGNQIKVKAGADLDYETEQNHKLDITVTDGTGHSYSERVSIAVNDINEAPTDKEDKEDKEDKLSGTDENDHLEAGEKGDELPGGRGDDKLDGGDGDDKLNGGSGDDTLTGGRGNDVAFGDEGNDSYFFNTFDGQDTFHGGEGWTDTINLSEVGADSDASWTITVDGEQVTPVNGESFIDFGEDTTGVVTMVDGSTLDFDGVESIQW